MTAVAKSGLAQAPFLLKAEPSIERQRARIVFLDANADPMHAPTIEARVESGL